jgi:hypothetical protein
MIAHSNRFSCSLLGMLASLFIEGVNEEMLIL